MTKPNLLLQKNDTHHSVGFNSAHSFNIPRESNGNVFSVNIDTRSHEGTNGLMLRDY